MSSRLTAALRCRSPSPLLVPAAAPRSRHRAPSRAPGSVARRDRSTFPRRRGWRSTIDAQDTSRATASLGFDGTLQGRRARRVLGRPTCRARETVRDPQRALHARKLTGTTPQRRRRHGPHRHVPLDASRAASPARDTATATVDGTAVLRSGKHVVSRCKIAATRRRVTLAARLPPGANFCAPRLSGACTPTPPASCSSRTTRSSGRSWPTTCTRTATSVLVADSLRDALRHARVQAARTSRCVDLGLPDGSGLELIRARPRGRRRRLAAGPLAAAGGHRLRPRGRARPRARVRARRGRLRGQAVLLRRAAAADRRRPAPHPRAPPPRAACGSATLEVDPAAREARVRGAAVDLAAKEFALLRTLAARPTRVFTKEELLRDVWGFRSLGIDAHAGLARLPAAPEARPRRRPVRRQRVGRRLPAGRRPGRGGGAVMAGRRACVVLGRPAGRRTLACVVARCTLPRRRAPRCVLVAARARHEVRGPLCAARLGLAGAAPPTRPRVAAIDLELRRAGRALDDLRPPPARRAPRSSSTCVRSAAPARRPGRRSPRRTARSCGSSVITEAPGLAAVDRSRAAAPPRRRRRSSRDPLRLAQACANLVANAAEHGGGVVRVRVRAARATTVRFEVADDGPGLPAPVGALVAAARSRRGRRGHGLAVAAAIVARATAAGSPPRPARASCSSCRPRRPPPSRRAARGRSAPDRGMTRRRRALPAARARGRAGHARGVATCSRRESALRAQLGPLAQVVVARRALAAGPRARAGRPRRPARPGPLRARRQRRVRGRAGRPPARGARAGGRRRDRGAARPARGGADDAVRRGQRAVDVVASGSPRPSSRARAWTSWSPPSGATARPGRARLALEDVEVLAARAAAAGDDGRTARRWPRCASAPPRRSI